MTQAGEDLGVVDLDGWVALRGRQTSREPLHDGARSFGSYSEAEPSLWERSTSTAWTPLAHDTEHREVGKNHAAGALNRYGARSWESFERHANRMRGGGAK